MLINTILLFVLLITKLLRLVGRFGYRKPVYPLSKSVGWQKLFQMNVLRRSAIVVQSKFLFGGVFVMPIDYHLYCIWAFIIWLCQIISSFLSFIFTPDYPPCSKCLLQSHSKNRWVTKGSLTIKRTSFPSILIICSTNKFWIKFAFIE